MSGGGYGRFVCLREASTRTRSWGTVLAVCMAKESGEGGGARGFTASATSGYEGQSLGFEPLTFPPLGERSTHKTLTGGL